MVKRRGNRTTRNVEVGSMWAPGLINLIPRIKTGFKSVRGLRIIDGFGYEGVGSFLTMSPMSRW